MIITGAKIFIEAWDTFTAWNWRTRK